MFFNTKKFLVIIIALFVIGAIGQIPQISASLQGAVENANKAIEELNKVKNEQEITKEELETTIESAYTNEAQAAADRADAAAKRAKESAENAKKFSTVARDEANNVIDTSELSIAQNFARGAENAATLAQKLADTARTDADKAKSEVAQKKENECLIATATYGSDLSPQVQMLREIRDNALFNTKSGTSFMTSFNSFYYSFSPTVAEWERQNEIFKESVKVVITPLIVSLSILSYVDIDSEVEILSYGIGVILLNIGIYFIAPLFIIMKFKQKIHKRN